jgi:hypothetical protein
MINRARLLLACSLLLALSSPGRAEVGVIVLEPVGALGFFTRAGHAAMYFSNICPDGSPIKLRLCAPGEMGGVVSRYSPLSENEQYDWAIVPFEAYLHGFESADLAPMIGTPGLQLALERSAFGPLFSSALHPSRPGVLPEGQWRAALATRFDRSLYIFAVQTSAADDATLVATFNAAPNKSRFNFFYRNCSDQARDIFNLILPDAGGIGDRKAGLTMETPKGLAKSLVNLAVKQPELQLQVRRYPQLPGTFPRSRNMLFPMENTYKSISFAPWWFFEGFRIVALGSMFYHQVMSPFGVDESARDFMSSRVSQLTLEERHLREQADHVRRTLAAISTSDSRRPDFTALYVRISRRLDEIGAEKRAEVNRVMGSPERWREIDTEFQALRQSLGQRDPVLKPYLAPTRGGGSLSDVLLDGFDTSGEFYVDEARGGPWLRLPLSNGETVSTGLSRAHVLAGDPRLAALVLAVFIDYNTRQSEARRENIDRVEWAMAQLRRVHETAWRRAPGSGLPTALARDESRSSDAPATTAMRPSAPTSSGRTLP